MHNASILRAYAGIQDPDISTAYLANIYTLDC